MVRLLVGELGILPGSKPFIWSSVREKFSLYQSRSGSDKATASGVYHIEKRATGPGIMDLLQI
ncbi:hypothetical protein ACSBR1_007353 [Camellia fascicularis]